MLKNALFLSLFLCSFFGLSNQIQAQKQKKAQVFEALFLEPEALAKLPEAERKVALLWGVFSDADFRKDHPSESMFEQPTDVVHFPIWKHRWEGQEEGWFYMARFFPAQANRPLTQYIAQFIIEDNRLKVIQYNLKAEHGQFVQKFWENAAKLEEISPEDLAPLDCHLQGQWENGQWLMQTTKPCEVAMPIGIQYTSLDGKISNDAWYMKITFKNAKDEIFYQDPEAVVFRRLLSKEVKKRLKFYESPKS